MAIGSLRSSPTFPAAAAVFSLDPWLGGPGCEIQPGNMGALIGVPSATNTFQMPLAVPTWVSSMHFYAQAFQLGASGGGNSKLLDINIK